MQPSLMIIILLLGFSSSILYAYGKRAMTIIEYHFTKFDYESCSLLIKWMTFLGGVFIILSILVRAVIKIIRKKEELSILTVKEKLQLFVVPIISVSYLLLYMFFITIPTFRHCVYLPYESENDAISIAGEIKNITPVSGSPRYYIGEDKTNYSASMIAIGDEEYYILTADGLKNGMLVEITYLPKSYMVLDCRQIESDTTLE